MGNRRLQRALSGRVPSIGKGSVPETVERRIARAKGGGQALDGGVRRQMEEAFGGVDFAGVRVHTDDRAGDLSRSLGARAFTVGQDVFFSRKYGDSGSHGSRELLAHELTHVLQQAGSASTGGLSVNRPGDRFEREADAVARQVIDRRPETSNVRTAAERADVDGSVDTYTVSAGDTIQRDGDVATEYVEPRAVYLIRESVHRVPGLPSIPYTGGQLGPFLVKIQRRVVQLHAVWEPAGGEPSTWEAIKDYLGVDRIERSYTGEHRWVQVFSGFRNIVQTTGETELFDVPNLGLYEYGDDPIPHVPLYGNTGIRFGNTGGQGAPTATALYDGSNNQLEQIPHDEVEAAFERGQALPGAQLEPGPRVVPQE